MNKGRVISHSEVSMYARHKFGIKCREIDPLFINKVFRMLLWTILNDNFVYTPSVIFLPRMKPYYNKVKFVDKLDKRHIEAFRKVKIKTPISYKNKKFTI